MDIDPNLHVVRSDAAAENLRGVIARATYLQATPASCAVPYASLWTAPSEQSDRASALVFGEAVDVYEQRDGWSWVQSRADRYVGYVRTSALTFGETNPTHWVCRPWMLVHPTPNLAAEPTAALPFGASVTVEEERLSERPSRPQTMCARIGSLGWAPLSALARGPLTAASTAEIAALFLGAPYLWGGRTAQGMDCSALVQTSLRARAITAPRDAYMQRAWDGLEEIAFNDLGEIRADDLVYMKGHVAISTGGGACIHACGQSMHVRREHLDDLLRARDFGLRDIQVMRLRGVVG